MVEESTRLTPQRKVILDVLQSTQSHPTADEIYIMVRKRLPHVSLGTIYRNLDFLHCQGLIRKLDKVGPQMRFDAFVDPHLHVSCVHCGKVADLPWDAASVVLRVQDRTAFEVTGHWLELYGRCPECQVEQKMDMTIEGFAHDDTDNKQEENV